MKHFEPAETTVSEVSGTEDWTDDEGEVRELTSADFATMKRFETLPNDLQRVLIDLNRATATGCHDLVKKEG